MPKVALETNERTITHRFSGSSTSDVDGYHPHYAMNPEASLSAGRVSAGFEIKGFQDRHIELSINWTDDRTFQRHYVSQGGGFSWEIQINAKARLMAELDTVSRDIDTGAPDGSGKDWWGYYPVTPDDHTDLRDYNNADIFLEYTGSYTVTINVTHNGINYSLTETIAAAQERVVPVSAMCMGGGPTASPDDPWYEGYEVPVEGGYFYYEGRLQPGILTASFYPFGQAVEPVLGSFDNYENGIRVTAFSKEPQEPFYKDVYLNINQGSTVVSPSQVVATSGDRWVGGYNSGHTPMAMGIWFNDCEPKKVINFNTQVYHGLNHPIASGRLRVNHYAGPENINNNLECHKISNQFPAECRRYKVIDGMVEITTVPGEDLSFDVPGFVQRVGRKYKLSVIKTGLYGGYEAHGGHFQAYYDSLDQIVWKDQDQNDHYPTIAMAFNPGRLEYEGMSKYAWRYPAMLPGDIPREERGFTILRRPGYLMENFSADRWIGEDGTQVTVSGTTLRLEKNSSPMIAVGWWGQAHSLNAARFIKIKYRTSKACDWTFRVTELQPKDWTYGLNPTTWKPMRLSSVGNNQWQEVIIDLCSPDSAGFGNTLSRWQLHYSNGNESATQSDGTWGIEPLRDGEPGAFTWEKCYAKFTFPTDGTAEVESIWALRSPGDFCVYVNEGIYRDDRFRFTDRTFQQVDYPRWVHRQLSIYDGGKLVEDAPSGLTWLQQTPPSYLELEVPESVYNVKQMTAWLMSAVPGGNLFQYGYSQRTDMFGPNAPAYHLVPGYYWSSGGSIRIPSHYTVDRMIIGCGVSLTINCIKYFLSAATGRLSKKTAEFQMLPGQPMEMTIEDTVVDSTHTDNTGAFVFPYNNSGEMRAAAEYRIRKHDSDEFMATNYVSIGHPLHGIMHRAGVGGEIGEPSVGRVSATSHPSMNPYIAYESENKVMLARQEKDGEVYSFGSVAGTSPSVATITGNINGDVFLAYNVGENIKSRIIRGYKYDEEKNMFAGKHPSVLSPRYDSGGSLHCAYYRDGKIYLRASTDGGATWGDERLVGENASDAPPGIASIPDVYNGIVVYYYTTTGNLVQKRSTDDGITWS